MSALIPNVPSWLPLPLRPFGKKRHLTVNGPFLASSSPLRWQLYTAAQAIRREREKSQRETIEPLLQRPRPLLQTLWAGEAAPVREDSLQDTEPYYSRGEKERDSGPHGRVPPLRSCPFPRQPRQQHRLLDPSVLSEALDTCLGRKQNCILFEISL